MLLLRLLNLLAAPRASFSFRKYPVRPGVLCRRRLDGILSASYQIQSPLVIWLNRESAALYQYLLRFIGC